jgi:hypothetical protein
MLVGQHHVLKLDVPVSDALAMQVAQSADELAPYQSRIVLRHASVGLRLQESVRRAAAHVLKYEDNLRVSLHGLVELSNIRMVDPLHKSDLPPDRLLPLDILNLLFFVDLQSNLPVQLFVKPDLDHGVGSLSNLLSYDIIVKRVLVREDDSFMFLFLLGCFEHDVLSLFLLLLHFILTWTPAGKTLSLSASCVISCEIKL